MIRFICQISQNNFRVIYHLNIDYFITKDSIKELVLNLMKKVNKYPLSGKYKLLSKKNYTTTMEYKFDKIFV